MKQPFLVIIRNNTVRNKLRLANSLAVQCNIPLQSAIKQVFS